MALDCVYEVTAAVASQVFPPRHQPRVGAHICHIGAKLSVESGWFSPVVPPSSIAAGNGQGQAGRHVTEAAVNTESSKEVCPLRGTELTLGWHPPARVGFGKRPNRPLHCLPVTPVASWASWPSGTRRRSCSGRASPARPNQWRPFARRRVRVSGRGHPRRCPAPPFGIEAGRHHRGPAVQPRRSSKVPPLPPLAVGRGGTSSNDGFAKDGPGSPVPPWLDRRPAEATGNCSKPASTGNGRNQVRAASSKKLTPSGHDSLRRSKVGRHCGRRQ